MALPIEDICAQGFDMGARGAAFKAVNAAQD